MKTLAYILIAFFSITNDTCKQSDLNIEEVSFTSRTRGGSKALSITKELIHFKINGEEIKVDNTNEKWEELSTIIKNLDYTKIDVYSVDKNDRARDAAWHSSINVVVDEIEYSSKTFDDAKAPDEFAELMTFLKKLDQEYNTTETRVFMR